MKIDLAGRPIIITGASSGIGRATAVRCAAAGMPVVLAARRAEKLEEAVGEIRAAGGRAEAVRADVTSRADCDAMIAGCAEAFGPVYAVFANAGYGLEAAVHETDDERMRAIFETNVYGTINTYEAALPAMLAEGRGHILICSSSVARMALPYFGAYCATKAAQHHLGRAMAAELRTRGIFVSTIHPVGTKTEFGAVTNAASESGTGSLDSHTPRWMMQTADTVAGSIVRCLRRPKPEVWPTWSVLVRLGMAVTVAFPKLGDLGVRRIARAHDASGSEQGAHPGSARQQ